jgi:hypothetical protein
MDFLFPVCPEGMPEGPNNPIVDLPEEFSVSGSSIGSLQLIPHMIRCSNADRVIARKRTGSLRGCLVKIEPFVSKPP